MGVYHFMGLGKAVGAVTCAVDYLEKAQDAVEKGVATEGAQRLFRGSGGVSHAEQSKGSIESIVFFTSKEVVHRDLQAFGYRDCAKPGQVRDEVMKHLCKIWRHADPDEGRKVWWCELEDIDDFRSAFRRVLLVTYRFSQPGKQGKEIWCNLTGGSNAINLSLMSMAQLTGKVTRHYLLGQGQNKEYQKEVCVPRAIEPLDPSSDGYFNQVPMVKTAVDIDGFYEVLPELESVAKPISARELLSRLQSKGKFLSFDVDPFVRTVLLKHLGLGYTTFDSESQMTQISDDGKAFLETELVELLDLEPGPDIIEQSKSWDWLTMEEL